VLECLLTAEAQAGCDVAVERSGFLIEAENKAAGKTGAGGVARRRL
jgi:hypothetical protein